VLQEDRGGAAGWPAIVRQQHPLEPHRLPATGADQHPQRTGGAGRRRRGLYLGGAPLQEQLATDACKESALAGTEQPVIAYLDQALGQDVLEEAPDELVRGERTIPGLAGRADRVAERDLVIRHADNPIVAQRDPKDIGGEIL